MTDLAVETAPRTQRGAVELGRAQGRAVLVSWDASRPVSLEVVSAGASSDSARTTQPLVEVLVVGQGRVSANLRNTATAVGARLRYRSHREWEEDGWSVLEVEQYDADSALTTISTLRTIPGRLALEAWTTVRNDADRPRQLQSVSSLMVTRPLGDTPISRIDSIEGTSEWLGENRWERRRLRDQGGLVRLDLAIHQHQDSRGARVVLNQGSWSSGQRVPTGVLVDREGGAALAWQLTHNGAWRAEFAERLSATSTGFLVLGLFGPTDTDHAWLHALAPGETFTSVPVAVAISEKGWEQALTELSALRRRQRRIVDAPTVIFNDYMNTLMGDPTTEKLLPLIEAAGRAGAGIFCIDCGWYADDGDWWDEVGAWEPSAWRFPNGLGEVVGRIRELGMVPGLWLEPEVIGVRSPMATALPVEAFLQRGGERIVEQGRFLLDLRHPAARAHLDGVVDRLVDQLGVGYFKMDYNVTPGLGTDLDAHSPGDGLLRQNRAHLDWIDGLLQRHPELVVENCASGAMRADYALLSRFHLQSTSDQQNPLLYPPVAAGAPLGLLPEQAANWAYPQPSMTLEQIAFTLCTGLAGRMQLSGRLHEMTQDQFALVREAVSLGTTWAPSLARCEAFWPLGLPQWESDWVALGLRDGTEALVIVWSRAEEPSSCELTVPAGEVDVVFPTSPTVSNWDITRTDPQRLRVRTVDPGPQARILRIRAR